MKSRFSVRSAQKPRSSWNAVIGGAAGAAAPLIADAAANGRVGAAGWLLFAIIFFWQPPHVWAIALFRKNDYARAGIPMLPNVIGDQPTRRRMLLQKRDHQRADFFRLFLLLKL